jgi:predicted branched-subunit amino acid permease
VTSAAFASIGQGAASRAGSVAWFLWVGFVAHRLWRATTSTGAPAADTVQA